MSSIERIVPYRIDLIIKSSLGWERGFRNRLVIPVASKVQTLLPWLQAVKQDSENLLEGNGGLTPASCPFGLQPWGTASTERPLLPLNVAME